MEGTPHKIVRTEILSSHEEAIDTAIVDGHTELERRLGKSIGEATALERYAVATELLKGVNLTAGNPQVEKVYEGVLKLAELELDFIKASRELESLYKR